MATTTPKAWGRDFSKYKYGTGYDDPTAPVTICIDCGGFRTGVVAHEEDECKCKWPKYGREHMTKHGFMVYWAPTMNCYVSIPDDIS